MESKNKIILGSAIGLVSLPTIARLYLGKGTSKSTLVEFSIYGLAVGALVGYFISSLNEKSPEKKSSITSGGKSFDEVCYKNCTNSCKLDDANCFTNCRSKCTSGGGKATATA